MIDTNRPLIVKEVNKIQKEYGSYVKVTADLETGWVVIGTELHADGEKILLEKGSKQDNIWGGGINFKDKMVDMTAVLNLRPRLSNTGLEIIDPQRRKKFEEICKVIFQELWK
ncbi:hypothetical protein COT52_00175 [candidate division WWE3 bacterium CG08_land_8_20_14_0_20_43_13]|uniref:Uncharacterized protein n=1 Tax=candidate division WWE3 bacterium CG08_land_8_20_14_0_20_43_13 TaxID=1975087 RepID=A0A2H0X8H4_UNCKA|nr:MAG: hypothetical protein COT52_00175 [candidate division WWE3 bacterium CG08_land_8_20_14_0_20_43_13]